MLTAAGFTLIYGRIYTFYSSKWVFLSGIFLFEVGSAICGAAPSSTVLIVGRAIAGFGSSGILTGAITIMINTIPLHKRPLYQGLFGACFAVASVAGPLMGGAFTDSKATWRWCFYINLPLGAVTMIALTLLLHLNEKKKAPQTWRQQISLLDPWGTACFLPAIICLLLALQWGGTLYPWGNWRIIVLFVFFSVLITAFIAIQVMTRDTTATIPARIITQRSVIAGCLYTFCLGSAFMIAVFYLPIWFQAIKGATAVKSGIMSIPLILACVVALIMCGGLVQRFGYYTPFMYAGCLFMSLGAGLVLTFTPSTGHSKWIGYQVIQGLGIGMGMQQANLAVQTVLPHKDIPTGSALVFFCQLLGGTIFVSVGQNLFLDKFLSQLDKLPAGIINPKTLMSAGATQIRDFVPKEHLAEVLEAYNYALVRGPLVAGLVMACLAIFGAIGMEWRSIKEKHNQRKSAEIKEEDMEKAAPVDKNELN
jgi:MFS family permease